jgi:OmpA-OmpF porin, OOP family
MKPILPIALLATLCLSGCAANRIALAPGENGQIAVLDPKTQSEISVIDKPGSITKVMGAKSAMLRLSDPEFEKRFAHLLAGMPQPPRSFTLYFKVNSINPTAQSEADMPAIFAEIKARPGADIQVTGHTDTVGSLEVNDAFSIRRAAEITSYLFTLGLDKAIVRLAGRGERELKEQTPDDTPSEINRRVEVLVR